MAAEPIVVTGLGVWSAAGTSPGEIWTAARTGRSPARPLTATPDSDPIVACLAPTPPGIPAFPQAHRMDRSVRLALAAAFPAFAAAQLHQVPPDRVALLVGNSRGPAELWQATLTPGRRTRPTQAARTAVASLSGALSLALGIRGPCLTLSATCASAAHAIAVGAQLLQGGVVDAVLAGGAEAPLVPVLLDQFRAAGLLASHPDPTRACRPFDAQRNGMVPGEGAGFLVLERAADARRRGAPIQSRLAAWAMGSECFNRVGARPDGQGLADTIHLALRTGSIDSARIAHVNTHGTGTRVNDVAEAAALHAVFGARLRTVPVTSTKPITGHGFGATAAWEAILTILALQHGEAPPTAAWENPDPALDLEPVHGRAAPIAGDLALSTSLGFWGNTAALVFGRPDPS